MRMHELRRRFRFAPKTLGDLGVARQVRMQNLDHDAPRELRLLGDVDLGHSAAAEAMQHAIAVSRGAAQARQLFVRAARTERARARATDRCTERTPPTTRGSRFRTGDKTLGQPPNCMWTKS